MKARIEQHHAWKGTMCAEEIEHFLVEQSAFTYVLTQTLSMDYTLSYIRGSDRKIIHIRFKDVCDANLQFRGYQNGTNIIFSSVEALIQYKLKGRGLIPEAISFMFSA